MSDLSGWGRIAGGSVLNPSDTCTGGRRAFIPETSGVIMPAPRIAALYGDSAVMDSPASPRNVDSAPFGLNSESWVIGLLAECPDVEGRMAPRNLLP